MTVYLAGPWKEREWVRVWAQSFEDRGMTISYPWWEHDVPDSDPLQLAQCAQNDFQAVMQSDCVVVYDAKVSEGKATELGVALALDIPIIILHTSKGPYHNIFHYLPAVRHCYHPDEVWDHLIEVAHELRNKGQREEIGIPKWDGEGHLGG